MEYIDGISLRELYNRSPNRRIDEKIAKKLMYQILEAMAYLHERHIAHRDIKLENILVTNKKIIKIIDLGFAIYNPNCIPQNFFCGTPNYMAPEIAYKIKYKPELSDLWSLGVLMYKMLCGEFPFKGKNEKDLYKNIRKCCYTINSDLSDNAANIIKSLIVLHPELRKSCRCLMGCDWFKTD